MESTGSFWEPVDNVLAGNVELLVVNAAHMKAVPGRKTDIRDAEWIADLLRHGLRRASLIPSIPERELRELTRYRTSLVGERTAELNRIAKVLEGANIKLTSVVTSMTSASGRAMIAAIVDGATDPTAMAELAQGRLRSKRPSLEAALQGRVRDRQRFILRVMLDHLGELEARIAELSAEIDARMHPFEPQITAVATITGIGRRTAQTVLAPHRPGHAPVSERRASRVVGGALSGQRRLGRQAAVRPDPSTADPRDTHCEDSEGTVGHPLRVP